MSGPRRAYELDLKVSADSRDDLCGYLHSFVTQLYMDQISNGASGGYSAGATYSLSVDESITHDSYVAALDDYLDRSARRGENA